MFCNFIKKDEAEEFAHMLNASISPENPVLFGAKDENGAVGVCVLDQTEVGQLELLWIYTVPEKRGQGVATAMVEALTAWADEYDYSLFASYEADEELDSIFAGRGFAVTMDLIKEYRVSFDSFSGVVKSLLNQYKGVKTEKVVTLRNINSSMIKKLSKRYMNPDDATYGLLTTEMLMDADMDLSLALVKDNEIRGLMLCRQLGNGEVCIYWLWDDLRSVNGTASIFKQFLAVIDNESAHIDVLLFAAMASSVENFAKKYFTDADIDITEMRIAEYR